MSNIKVWISAMRLQTLPLALSCILVGSSLAFASGIFRWPVFVLALITTLLLQILSNLANDYGDAIKGTDGEGRLGPKRAVQSGEISAVAMKRAVIITSLLTLLIGVALLFVSFPSFSLIQFSFLALGLMAIAAAIKYTVGKGAYGYSGMGDLFVLLFFGLVGVLGSFYLYGNYIMTLALLPALSIGFWSVGVLNLNNLRDIENDEKHGKITVAVRLGKRKTQIYHLILLSLGWLCALIYWFKAGESIWELAFVLTLPIFVANLRKVFSHKQPKELIPSLKQLALGTFFFSVLFAAGIIIGHA